MVCKEKRDERHGEWETKLKPRWWTEECSSRKKERKEKVMKFIRERNSENKSNMNRAKKMLEETIKEAVETWEQERWLEISEAKSTSEWWRGIRKYRVRKRGKVDKTIEKVAWRDHFASLLNRQGYGIGQKEISIEGHELRGISLEHKQIDNENLDASFSENKIEEGFNSLASGEALGGDGIMGEFSRATGWKT